MRDQMDNTQLARGRNAKAAKVPDITRAGR